MTDYEIEAYVKKAVEGLRSTISKDIFELHAMNGVHNYLLQTLYAMEFRGKEEEFKGVTHTMLSRARMDANNADTTLLTNIHKRHEQLLEDFSRNVSARLKAMKR